MKNFLTQVKINYLRIALRNKRFVFFSLAFPVMFYLLFTKVMNVGVPTAAMKTWQLEYMVSMAIYSSLISCITTASSTLLEDREKHFTLFIRLTGGGNFRYYSSMVAVFLPLTIVSILLLGLVAGLVNGVSLTALYWLVLAILLPLLSIPFLLIGILLSLSGSENVVNFLGQIIMFAFAIIGGLWWPIELLPNWLQSIGERLPTHQVNSIIQAVLHQNTLQMSDILGLLLWSLGTLLAIALVSRHLRLREVQTI